MEEKINDFIKRRFNKEDNWLNGNCLWFAYILQKRFPNLNIYYCPIDGHFLFHGNDNQFYDWSGRCEYTEEHQSKMIRWQEYANEDSTHYSRIWRDCIR